MENQAESDNGPPENRINITKKFPARPPLSSKSDVSENQLVSTVPEAISVCNYDTDNDNDEVDQPTDDPKPFMMVTSDSEHGLNETNANENETNTNENNRDNADENQASPTNYVDDYPYGPFIDMENYDGIEGFPTSARFCKLDVSWNMYALVKEPHWCFGTASKCQKRSVVPEILSRAHGFTPRSADRKRTNALSMTFQNRTNGTILNTIHTLQLHHRLHDVHTGSVNGINFSSDGSRLCSGSVDKYIVVWKWTTKKVDIKFHSGHKKGVTQTKFMDFGGVGNTIVSSDRTGEVRLHRLLPDGGYAKLSHHTSNSAVHKLVVSTTSVSQFFSAGEDANIFHYDLRANKKNPLTTVTTEEGDKVKLCSISHHPTADKFCVGGYDRYVQVFDCRNAKTPLTRHCADEFSMYPCINCVTYNWNGLEIAAAYSVRDICLFDANRADFEKYLHQYKGPWDDGHGTIEDVRFFGKYSEYVASAIGSGHIHMWEKNTEEPVLYQLGDYNGSVNVIETHPHFPIMATTGLDRDVKIWLPAKWLVRLDKRYKPSQYITDDL